MHKVSRSLLLAGVMAFGTLTAACGDKVNIVQPTSTAPTGITSITVTPPSATIGIGATNAISLAVSVVADASTAKTVAWTSSSAAVATVDATGKVTGVSAGTATIIATSTIDPTKAAAAVITVAGGSTTPTVNTVAISTVTAGGLNVPIALGNVFGQIDVTLFISGPGGTLNLIQNCTAAGATSTTGDVVVAQQQVAGSQNQSPVTLSYNTAATGAITNGVAVPNATSSTPIALNGNCVLKASLGTATATNVTPFTLNNANRFIATTTFTKTTTLGSQGVISNVNGLSYNQGDLKVDLSPVVYTTSAPGVAQVPALSTITYAGRVFTNSAATAGKFSVTFPSTGATAQNINQYTSPAAGDNVTVSGYADTNGQTITIGNPIVTTAVLRSDNQSPTTGGPLAQALNPFTVARNYINASYSFATNNTAQTDAAYANAQNSVNFYYGNLPASGALPNAAVSTNAAGAGCSITGLTKVTTGADIPQTPFSTSNGFAPGYYVRVIENDPLGNVVCQDFGTTNTIVGFGVDKQNPNDVTVTSGPANQTVVTPGTSTNTYFSVDSVSGFDIGQQFRSTSVRNFTQANCVVGTLTAGVCTPNVNNGTVQATGASVTEGYYTATTYAQDQAGNQSNSIVRTYLVDTTIPTVGGISIPQTLTGGATVSFSSQARDNVDLRSSSFDLTYSAAAGSPVLYYAGDNYGPNYDATRKTDEPLTATVPFFIKQIQNTTAGNAPIAFATGVGSDSGKATTITVRAIDAANLVSANSFAGIPAINIANSAGYTTSIATFAVNSTAAAVPNGAATGLPATASATLSAAGVYNGADAQSKNVPFGQVCFFYVQTAAGNAANNTIPTGDLVSVGCVSLPDIADVAGVSRTWTYRLPGFNPPQELGTGVAVTIYAIGVNSNGVGIISQANGAVTLVP